MATPYGSQSLFSARVLSYLLPHLKKMIYGQRNSTFDQARISDCQKALDRGATKEAERGLFTLLKGHGHLIFPQ